MKNRLVICLLLLLSAVVSSTLRAQPTRSGFSVHGVGLGWNDEKVEALVGGELKESDCPEDGAHFNHYEGGLWVLFDKMSYQAEMLSGSYLEFDGQVVVQQGDLVKDITEPPISEIPLEGGGRLVARPVPVGYFAAEAPKYSWEWIPTKGSDRVFRVAYRYQAEDGTMTDAYDVELSIFALGEQVERVQLRGMGH